jgi:hypothetical protein
MENIYIIPGAIELALISEELEKTKASYDEMMRLRSIGYGISQMALDQAKAAVSHMHKALDILLKVKPSGYVSAVVKLTENIAEGEIIALRIEYYLKHSEGL